jgi:MFS family permease
MTPHSPAARDPGNSLWAAFFPLLPFMLTTFVGFVATGMTLSVVPRHVHDTLGQGTVMIGVVMGIQYLSAVGGRIWSGTLTDVRGPRFACLWGLAAVAGVGALYLLSMLLVQSAPQLSLALVMAGRLANGIAESFIITSTMTWGLARVGPAHAGKVFGWMGVALFGGLAAGSPVGMAVYGQFGFAGVALALLLVGLAGLAGTTWIQGVQPSTLPRLPFREVLGAVKWPGLGLTLCSVGYSMITAFAVLLFAQREWGGGALAVTCMGAGFIVGRMLFGHLPDQVGGARVAVYCGIALGLFLIWAAPVPALAWLGAALTGGGYGLGFQGFGVEAVRRAPPQSRGSVMGAYSLFQDLALGLAPPLGGLLARVAGLESVYFAAGLGSVGALLVALVLRRKAA